MLPDPPRCLFCMGKEAKLIAELGEFGCNLHVGWGVCRRSGDTGP